MLPNFDGCAAVQTQVRAQLVVLATPLLVDLACLDARRNATCKNRVMIAPSGDSTESRLSWT